MSEISWPKVVVIGGGVNGIGTALALLQKYPKCHLTICSEKFSPETTGDVAAGIWLPYQCPGTPSDDIVRWSKLTWDFVLAWWKAGVARINLVPLITHSKVVEPVPKWKHIPFNFKELSKEEAQSAGSEYVSGFSCSVLIAEASAFLPLMTEEIKKLGGSFRKVKFSTLAEAASNADLVINCSGLGARQLVPDPTVYPIRGQIMRVKAPWIKNNMMCVDAVQPTYIIVNQDSVILGGTTQANNWSTEVSLEDTQNIWRNCCRVMPSLKESTVLGQWADLRPARSGGVRLEEDLVLISGKKVPVIHNYGHGGSGITLFWGCAQDAASLAQKKLQKFPLINSNL